MPLSQKGAKIMKSMKGQYRNKKGDQVFYASKNAGKIKGVEKRKKLNKDAVKHFFGSKHS